MLNSKKSLSIFICIVILMVIAAGCGGSKPLKTGAEAAEKKEVQAEKQEEKTEKQEVKAEDVRVVEHAMGSTEITGTPTRIVTLYQGATDVTIALGVTPIGVVESWTQQPMYEYLREDLINIPFVGLETQPNLEEIAKLKPDLIIASKLRHEKVYEQLSKIAPTVTHETVYKFKDTVELIGQAANLEEKADQLLADWDNRVADFTSKVSVKLGDQWPVKTSVLNFRTDHARIYVTGFGGDILSELGFIRSELQQKAADEGKVVLKLTDKESIPSMNADVFFIFNADGHSPDADLIKKTYDEWTSHPLWNSLDAVKNNQVTIVDDVAWNMGGGYISANQMLDQIYKHFELEKE